MADSVSPQPPTAMILAAGLGTRLAPLTRHTPKPLLEAGGRPLIEHHLERLAALGVRRVVVNLHHLGDQIRQHLGDGARWGLEIRYSQEADRLETAGGIHQALPLLGNAPFLVVNGDVFCDFDLARLPQEPPAAGAHLVLVPRPPWQQRGDFSWQEPAASDGPLQLDDQGALTYAGIGLYHPGLFRALAPGFAPLRPVLAQAAAAGCLSGQLHDGFWEDVGTLERLQALRERLAS